MKTIRTTITLTCPDDRAIHLQAELSAIIEHEIERGCLKETTDTEVENVDYNVQIVAGEVDEYLADGGGHCPFCNSDDIFGGKPEVDGDRAWCEVECDSCGEAWQDTYELTGFIHTLE